MEEDWSIFLTVTFLKKFSYEVYAMMKNTACTDLRVYQSHSLLFPFKQHLHVVKAQPIPSMLTPVGTLGMTPRIQPRTSSLSPEDDRKRRRMLCGVIL